MRGFVATWTLAVSCHGQWRCQTWEIGWFMTFEMTFMTVRATVEMAKGALHGNVVKPIL